MDFNTIYFTAKDDTISGTSQRDPLGLQPIWSFFGRQVINHLTTISTSIHGFREVLLCLSICNDVYNEKRNLKYTDLILYFEQLFIYSSISHGRIEGILGADNGNARFNENNGNPEISIRQTILVREISLGYYGRYKTPLSTMGIINNKSGVEIEINQIKKYYGESLYLEIKNEFASFISSNNKKFNTFRAKEALYKAIFGTFRPGEYDFWINRLNEVSGEKKELMELCYKKADKYPLAKDLFMSLNQKKEVLDIIKLESFLRCLEEVFYKAMMAKDIASVKIEDIEEHWKRYNEFCSITITNESSLFTDRIKYLKEQCSPKTENYIMNVIKYHELVCKQKKSAVWLELDSSGRLQAFVNTNDVVINIQDWGRDYYLSSLKSIKAEILEFLNE